MVLDAQTLLIMYAVLQVMQTAMAVTLWLGNRRIGGLGWWVAGMALGALTLPLFSLQFQGGGKIDAYLLPILMSLGTSGTTYIGACRFRGVPVRWSLLGWATAAAVAGNLWFLWGNESLAGRGVVIAIFMVGCYGGTAAVLWREDRLLVRRTARALAGAYALGASLMLCRIPLFILDPGMAWAPGNAAKTSVFLLVGIILIAIWVFFLVLLVSRVEAHERHLRRLEEQESDRALRDALLEVEAQKAARLRENLARDLHDGIGSITANVAMLASLGVGEIGGFSSWCCWSIGWRPTSGTLTGRRS